MTFSTTIGAKSVRFFDEWLKSSADLLFEPAKFAPPAAGAGAGRGVRGGRSYAKELGFAGSSALAALLVMQLVPDTTFVGRPWNGLTESIPFATLAIAIWTVWALVYAFLFRSLGGAQSAYQNIIVGLRLQSMIYLLSIVIGVMGFVSTAGNWTVFQVCYLVAGLAASIAFGPRLFVRMNGLTGGRAVFAATLLVLTFLFRSYLGFTEGSASRIPLPEAPARARQAPLPSPASRSPASEAPPPLSPPPVRQIPLPEARPAASATPAPTSPSAGRAIPLPEFRPPVRVTPVPPLPPAIREIPLPGPRRPAPERTSPG